MILDLLKACHGGSCAYFEHVHFCLFVYFLCSFCVIICCILRIPCGPNGIRCAVAGVRQVHALDEGQLYGAYKKWGHGFNVTAGDICKINTTSNRQLTNTTFCCCGWSFPCVQMNAESPFKYDVLHFSSLQNTKLLMIPTPLGIWSCQPHGDATLLINLTACWFQTVCPSNCSVSRIQLPHRVMHKILAEGGVSAVEHFSF